MDTSQFPVESVTLQVQYTHDKTTSKSCLARINNVLAPICSMEGQEFGIVTLASCLDAICKASPEVLSSESTDYAVYSLDVVEQDAPFVGHGKLSTLRVDSNSSLKVIGLVHSRQLPFQAASKSLGINLKLVSIPGTSHYQQFYDGPDGLSYPEYINELTPQTQITTQRKRIRSPSQSSSSFAHPASKPNIKRSRYGAAVGGGGRHTNSMHQSVTSYLASSPIAFGNMSTDEDQNELEHITPVSEPDMGQDRNEEDDDEHDIAEFMLTFSSPNVKSNRVLSSSPKFAKQISSTRHATSSTPSGSEQTPNAAETMSSTPATSACAPTPADSATTPESTSSKSKRSTKKATAITNASSSLAPTPATSSSSGRSKKPNTTIKKPNSKSGTVPSKGGSITANFGAQCSNCKTTNASAWRRIFVQGPDSLEHKTFCNPCGLYFSKKGEMRPANLWRSRIQPRRRKKCDGQYDEDEDDDSPGNAPPLAATSPVRRSRNEDTDIDTVRVSASSPAEKRIYSSPNNSLASEAPSCEEQPSSPPSSEAYISAAEEAKHKNSISGTKSVGSAVKMKNRQDCSIGDEEDKENVPPQKGSDSHRDEYELDIESLFATPKQQRTPIRTLSENALNFSPASSFWAKAMNCGSSGKKDGVGGADHDPFKGILTSPSPSKRNAGYLMDVMDMSMNQDESQTYFV